MAIHPVELFSQDPGFIGDFSQIQPGEIFNRVIAARVNGLESRYAAPEPEEEEDALPPPDIGGLTPRDLFNPPGSQESLPLPAQQAPDIAPPMEENYNAPVLQARPQASGPPMAGDPADFIFNSEARRGPDGKLQVYQPPSGDGGGAFEVAGITARYQPQEAARLRDLINSGRSDEAEAEAKAFYRKRAAPFTAHTANKGLQLQLADAVHHRGEGGLRRILQRAAGSDSKDYATLIGSLSSRPDGLEAFDQARRAYEWEEVDRGRDSRKKFRKGLENRFDKAAAAARQFTSM